jgi:TPR repeat protein
VPEAQNSLGVCYVQSRGVQKDTSIAVKFYHLAADQGLPEAQYNLALHYLGTQDEAKAAQWFGRAAEAGHTLAQTQYAYCLFNGLGLPTDLAKAAEWYRKAAEKGEVNAQYSLGLCYEQGYGVIPDFNAARHWLKLAALQDCKEAAEELVRLDAPSE